MYSLQATSQHIASHQKINCFLQHMFTSNPSGNRTSCGRITHIEVVSVQNKMIPKGAFVPILVAIFALTFCVLELVIIIHLTLRIRRIQRQNRRSERINGLRNLTAGQGQDYRARPSRPRVVAPVRQKNWILSQHEVLHPGRVVHTTSAPIDHHSPAGMNIYRPQKRENRKQYCELKDLHEKYRWTESEDSLDVYK